MHSVHAGSSDFSEDSDAMPFALCALHFPIVLVVVLVLVLEIKLEMISVEDEHEHDPA